MTRFWKSEDDLEAGLRASRPEPSPQFVRALARRVEKSTSSHSRRITLAVGFATVSLAVFGAFGGLGYAAKAVSKATGIGNASHDAAQVSVKGNSNSAHGNSNSAHGNSNSAHGNSNSAHGNSSSTPANDQYAGKTTICHRTGSQKNPWVIITVSNNALPAHKAHGDTLVAADGTCPGPPIP
jgi:hypothetical protein